METLEQWREQKRRQAMARRFRKNAGLGIALLGLILTFLSVPISWPDASRPHLHGLGCLHVWPGGICTMTQLPVTPEQRLETLREWLEKSEETGHYRGLSRHQLALMIHANISGNTVIDCSNEDQAGLRPCLFLCLRDASSWSRVERNVSPCV